MRVKVSPEHVLTPSSGVRTIISPPHPPSPVCSAGVATPFNMAEYTRMKLVQTLIWTKTWNLVHLNQRQEVNQNETQRKQCESEPNQQKV